jgi:DNA-binding transcriptional LysR family regulator
MVDAVSITLTQLRSFLAVVHGGSVTAAAEELVVTQPAISAAVTALSREVGVNLLERAGRGVRPTPAGREFAAYAADVIGLLEQGRHAARDAEALGSRTLTIAAVTTAAESFVPPLMRAFATANPQVGLSLDVGNRDHVLSVVQNHEADLAIGGRPPPQARIEAHAILANELMLITGRDDPLAAAGTVSAARLAGRRWLLREPGSGTRAVNEEFLASAGIAVQTMTLGSNGAIKQAARAGLGVSFVSRAAVATELDAGLLGTIAVASAPVARDWYVMRSSVGPSRQVATDFLEFATSVQWRRGPSLA